MRREEAEQEAAWRNAHDERRSRLEFYAFDASAGLAESAWEVTMRLRRGPVPPAAETVPAVAAVPAPTAAPARLQAETAVDLPPPATAPWEDDQDLSAPELEPATVPAPPRRSGPRRPRRDAPPARLGPSRRTRRRERREAERAERGPRPSRTFLERMSRFVGAMVILVAVIWLGLITALAVLVGATSPTGVAVYVGALLAGLVAVGFGVLVRRA
jgi:hypothetical protein